MSGVVLETDRLLLRTWRHTDFGPFAALNGDPAVRRYFPSVLTREESDAEAGRIVEHFREFGFGPWAAELRDTGEFIGYVGLVVPRFEAHFTPAVEIGWRLASQWHDRGYATEGAHAVVAHAFGALNLHDLVSFTVPENLPSRRVMEKIGMTHDPADDFDHPRLPRNHHMRRHVLYRLGRRD